MNKADVLRRLHVEGPMLVLPNAWDAGSARIFVEAGFPALATTSAGIAFSLGYPDGERISRDEMLAAVSRSGRRFGVRAVCRRHGHDRTARAADPRAAQHPRHTQRSVTQGAGRAGSATRDVWLGADACDARPGAPDGSGMEGEGDLRNTRGVRDPVL